jgi:hypothetical protein
MLEIFRPVDCCSVELRYVQYQTFPLSMLKLPRQASQSRRGSDLPPSGFVVK